MRSRRSNRAFDGFTDYLGEPAYDPSDFLAQYSEPVVVDQRAGLAERYVNGDTGIRVKLKTSVRGIDSVSNCSLIYGAVRDVALPFNAGGTVVESDRRSPLGLGDAGDHGVNEPVFVDVVQRGQNLQRVRSIRSVERLELLDREDHFLRSTEEVAAALRFPLAAMGGDGELQAVVGGWLGAIQYHELVDRVVERRTEVVDDLADNDSPFDRRLLKADYPDRVYPGIFVMVVGQTEILVFDPRRCQDLQVLDLRIGPVEASPDCLERAHA